jgi:putative restriction endonuclease
MSLDTYLDKFSRLNVDIAHGSPSPHKICMLLALLDLARAGGLLRNRIAYEPALLERYRYFFEAVKSSKDDANPHLPFFHLRGALKGGEKSFWHLKAKAGYEHELLKIRRPRKHSDITDNIEFAQLDDELFTLIQDPSNIDMMMAYLADQWFDRGLQDLRTVVARSAEVSQYERTIRTATVIREPTVPVNVRNSAFRRVVTEAYDYRCVATGLRILLPSGEAMVEAAHIHPFSEAGDDDPRNGIALTPDMHWAMDRNLIAPGPDLRWHVSPLIDPRIPDLKALRDLDGRRLFPPKELRLTPKRDALEWRVARLRDLNWTFAQDD